MSEGLAVTVVLATPVKPELAEDLAEVTNALNRVLPGVGLWADLVHGARAVYLVLLRAS